jgi:quinol-cytochrome oxidoreductase complex cytochrome b subunit
MTHILVLHEEGSSNPIGVQSIEKANFTTFLYKDLFYFFFFLVFLTYFVFFDPTAFMHNLNFQQANMFVTPKNIVPE